MSWVLTVGIDKFLLSDQEKAFYIHAVAAGEKHIQIRHGLYVGANYQSLVETSEQNPILNSPSYIEWISLKEKSDDASTRRKMALERAIGIQFPYEQFSKEWEETYRTEKAIVKSKT